MKRKKNNNFIDELAKSLPEAKVKRAKQNAEKEILQIRLAEIREKRGLRQEDIKSFSQSGVSKLEARRDMKISTLVEYLHSLGLSIEIKAYPKDKKNKDEEIIILRA